MGQTEIKSLKRDMLRFMEDGQTAVYKLPDAAACNSARTTAYLAAPVLGCKFITRVDYNRLTVEVTKIARP